MGAKTKIEWTDATWNPIIGCSRVSEGCRNCYAEVTAARFGGGKETVYSGLTQIVNGRAVWTGKIAETRQLLQPLSWRQPKRVFVNSMSDLFHENVAEELIGRIFAVMALCPEHTFQVLTKRARLMQIRLGSGGLALEGLVRKAVVALVQEWIKEHDRNWYRIMEGRPVSGVLSRDGWNITTHFEWPLPNVWMGVSVENQAAADERIPLLLQTPAAVRFISAEPLLGPLDLSCIPWPEGFPLGTDDLSDGFNALRFDDRNSAARLAHLNWVICGGESGPRARPMHPDWARSLRDQCAKASVPFFFKQWGRWAPGSNFQTVGVVAIDEIGRTVEGGLLENFPTESSSADGWEMMHSGSKSENGHLLDAKKYSAFPEGR